MANSTNSSILASSMNSSYMSSTTNLSTAGRSYADKLEAEYPGKLVCRYPPEFHLLLPPYGWRIGHVSYDWLFNQWCHDAIIPCCQRYRSPGRIYQITTWRFRNTRLRTVVVQYSNIYQLKFSYSVHRYHWIYIRCWACIFCTAIWTLSRFSWENRPRHRAPRLLQSESKCLEFLHDGCCRVTMMISSSEGSIGETGSYQSWRKAWWIYCVWRRTVIILEIVGGCHEVQATRSGETRRKQ